MRTEGNASSTVMYRPDLGLCGELSLLIDQANRYTGDFTDDALDALAHEAAKAGAEGACAEVPKLLKLERALEGDGTLASAYARLRIDRYLGDRVSMSMSNFTENGTELEVYEDGGKVVVSLCGANENGAWTAASACDIKEFMDVENEPDWLDRRVGETLYYSKQHEDEREAGQP